ncbi:MAG: AAA family ATPase [Oceanospirillales bacterium]|nr:AAA family ATPase [Oceanospirillales bacterium]
MSSLKIKNFRSCANVDALLSRFTPLVGYNNAGKSNILTALSWLLRGKLLTEADFFESGESISVEGLIEGITDDALLRLHENHRRRIQERLVGENLLIRRTQPADATKKSDVKLEVYNPQSESFGPPPNGLEAGISKLFPEPIRIGAMENAAEDSTKAKTSSTIGKLLNELSQGVQAAHHQEIEEHLEAVRGFIDSSGANRFGALSEIDGAINDKISSFFPGVEIKLHFPVPDFAELFSKGTVKVFEDGDTPRDFENFGHGAQRSIQMALIQYLAEVKQTANVRTTTLLLIDEPELYLHPFAIEQIRTALLTLSKHGYQVVFSTHSPQMVTAEHAHHTLLIRKEDGQTKIRKRLEDAIRDIEPRADHQITHLFSLTQSHAFLFADKVVLTEGKTEHLLLPALYQSMTGRTLAQDKIALIPVGGVDSLAKCIRILQHMDIPTIAIADLDYGFRGAIDSGMANSDDPSLVNLRTHLQSLANQDQIALDQNGLPSKRNSPVSPSKAFEILAEHDDARPSIESLHQHLKNNRVWLWRKGAIEPHLGLEGKGPAHWASFSDRLSRDGFEAVCADHQSIRELFNWIREQQ